MPDRLTRVALGVDTLSVTPMLAFCRLLLLATALLCGLAAAADRAPVDPGARQLDTDQLALINRLTWGATPQLVQTFLRAGHQRYIDDQLKPGDPKLPAAVQQRLDGMKLGGQSAETAAREIHTAARKLNAVEAGPKREKLRPAYQQLINEYAEEARQRSLLRALYSDRQLQEKMTWFWFNHFNVVMQKNNTMRGLISDYEENAIRPHALGKFEDLLKATMRHPAMLIYLDNTQNHVGKPNENYGRELLELHTLGADAGYTQADVQALSRVLTGVGVNYTDKTPKMDEKKRQYYVRQGVFEFNPQRHDFKEKQLLGKTLSGKGLQEVDEVAKLLAHHPATARHISRKLAMYFVSDNPPDSLIEHLSHVFTKSDGDIAATLRALFESVPFQQSLHDESFRDPTQYVLAAVRLVHGTGDPIINARPIFNWMSRLGQPLFGKETPDGYSLQRTDWQGSGQMTERFVVARSVAGANPALYLEPDGPNGKVSKERLQKHKRKPPDTARKLYQHMLAKGLSAHTRKVLAQAKNTHEWTSLLLSTPDFMNH